MTGRAERQQGSYPVILSVVKTAISIPDETFARASARAGTLVMSRSQFFTRAAERYLDDLDAKSLTRHIDAAVALVDGRDEAASAAVTAGHRMLMAEDDW